MEASLPRERTNELHTRSWRMGLLEAINNLCLAAMQSSAECFGASVLIKDTACIFSMLTPTRPLYNIG